MVRLASLLTMITVLLTASIAPAEANNNDANTLKTVVVKPDSESRVKLKVFKDPAVNQIKFRYEASDDDKPVMVQLEKTTGITVKAFSLTKGLTKVNTTQMKPGLYKYHCVTKNGETLTSGKFTVLQ
jgi:hypothetical protein